MFRTLKLNFIEFISGSKPSSVKPSNSKSKPLGIGCDLLPQADGRMCVKLRPSFKSGSDRQMHSDGEYFGSGNWHVQRSLTPGGRDRVFGGLVQEEEEDAAPDTSVTSYEYHLWIDYHLDGDIQGPSFVVGDFDSIPGWGPLESTTRKFWSTPPTSDHYANPFLCEFHISKMYFIKVKKVLPYPGASDADGIFTAMPVTGLEVRADLWESDVTNDLITNDLIIVETDLATIKTFSGWTATSPTFTNPTNYTEAQTWPYIVPTNPVLTGTSTGTSNLPYDHTVIQYLKNFRVV